MVTWNSSRQKAPSLFSKQRTCKRPCNAESRKITSSRHINLLGREERQIRPLAKHEKYYRRALSGPGQRQVMRAVRWLIINQHTRTRTAATSLTNAASVFAPVKGERQGWREMRAGYSCTCVYIAELWANFIKSASSLLNLGQLAAAAAAWLSKLGLLLLSQLIVPLKARLTAGRQTELIICT